MTTTRSSSGMYAESALSIDVLPVPVPPATRMLSFARTSASSASAHTAVSDPDATRRAMSSTFSGNFRIEMWGPSGAAGGRMASTREPPGRRASRIGRSASTCLPTNCARLRSADMSDSRVSKVAPVSSRRPARSMKIWSGPLMQMSVTAEVFEVRADRREKELDERLGEHRVGDHGRPSRSDSAGFAGVLAVGAARSGDMPRGSAHRRRRRRRARPGGARPSR